MRPGRIHDWAKGVNGAITGKDRMTADGQGEARGWTVHSPSSTLGAYCLCGLAYTGSVTLRSTRALARFRSLALFAVLLQLSSEPAAAHIQMDAIDLGNAVGEPLNKYVALHDELFRVSVGRLVPVPGIFEAIPFDLLRDSLRATSDELRYLRGEADLYLRQGEHTDNERRFVSALLDYLIALDSTVVMLIDVAEKLYQKSQDPSEYRWSEYTANIEAYRLSVDHYVGLGRELNRLARNLPRS